MHPACNRGRGRKKQTTNYKPQKQTAMKKYTKDIELNDMLNNVAEISLSYNYKVKAKDRAKATNSEELAKAFFGVYDKGSIEVTETSYCAVLDGKMSIIGIIKIGEGDSTTTHMNINRAFQAAIMCNGKYIAVCHNHPSGSLNPSEPDKRMTRLFCEGAKTINMRLIDHIILSPDGDCFSFNENGMI